MTPLLDVPTIEQELSAIERELQRRHREFMKRSLVDFTRHTFQDYEVNWHHQIVAAALDRVLAGLCRRLMILMPPQNGKSELVSRRFPAYAFGKNPDLRIIACSYDDEWAQSLSRDVQKIMASQEYVQLFPLTRLAEARDLERRTQGQFDVVGRRGYYVASGIMGSITGRTADIGIIDDPVRNRADAESETYRERTWDQYVSAFTTRQFGSGGSIILCCTRWHEDDLAGRLLDLMSKNPAADQWEIISLPAIAEVEEVHRHVGEALWPSKYSLEELHRRRAGMGEYEWASLFQQRPAPEGGGLFKREWFRFVDAVPTVARRVRGWDTASTPGAGDWTCGVKVAEARGLFFVEDVTRGQWGPGAVDAIIKQTAEMDGRGCAQREEKEGGSAGVAVVAARTKTLAGVDYAGVSITGSKVTRARPFRAQLEAGNAFLIRSEWNEAYIKELCSFPTGKHDDQVDATSCAFNAVLLEPAAVYAAPTGIGEGRSYWQGPR